MYGKNIGVKFDEEKLNLFSEIVQNVSNIVIFVGNIIFICEKPQVLWNNGLLHSETNPAISWKDGTGFYYLQGRKLDNQEQWEKVKSEKMAFSEILKINNTEIRLLAMKYNPSALLSENPKLVNKTKRGNELYLIQNSKVNKFYDEPKVWLLGFIDPSKLAPNNKMYEEVSPELAETTQNADVIQAYHLGWNYEQYKLLKQES